MAIDKVLLTKTAFMETIILLSTFTWVIGPLSNRAGRNPDLSYYNLAMSRSLTH